MKLKNFIKKHFLIIAIVLAVAVAGCATVIPVINARADFGDFGGDVDYGGGGGWDYGGGGWDSGDSWGSGGDSWIFFGGSGSSSSSSSNSPVYTIILIIIVIAYIVIRFGPRKYKKSKRSSAASRPAGAQPTSTASLKPMNTYTNVDPSFNESMFKEKLSNLYVQMQNCWTDKNIEPLRPYFTDAYFTQMERSLDSYKRLKKTNYVDKIAVLDTKLVGWKQQGNEDHIIVTLRTRIVDYTLDDTTGRLLSGDQNAEKFMTYEWDLCRTTGLKTATDEGITRTTCPSCGAPIDINVSARCEYCGNIVQSSTFSWAICQIKGISQETVRK